MCLHCDFCVVVLENSFDEIVCEAAKAVSVGKMHDAYTPIKDLLKKRQQSFAPEVEARRTISEHDGGGIFGLEPLDLGFEILILLPRRHPGVDGFEALVFIFG